MAILLRMLDCINMNVVMEWFGNQAHLSWRRKNQ